MPTNNRRTRVSLTQANVDRNLLEMKVRQATDSVSDHISLVDEKFASMVLQINDVLSKVPTEKGTSQLVSSALTQIYEQLEIIVMGFTDEITLIKGELQDQRLLLSLIFEKLETLQCTNVPTDTL